MSDSIIELILCVFFGFFGVHKFYRGKNGLGVLYLFTFGLFFFGWAIDSVLLLIKVIKLIQNKQPETQTSSAQRGHNTPQITSKYKLITFKVVGVTYKNEDGQSRQRLLRRFKWKDEPFDGDLEVRLSETSFEGQPAIEVIANDNVLGFVPRDRVPEILDVWERVEDIDSLNVYGGQDGHSFGAEVTIKVRSDF